MRVWVIVRRIVVLRGWGSDGDLLEFVGALGVFV